MPVITATVSKWGLPDNLVDCLEGGFKYKWDTANGAPPRSVGHQTLPPIDDGLIPPPPPPIPDDTWLKADIVQWLLNNGVSHTQSALMALTKVELLQTVVDLLDTEVEPTGG